LIAELLPTGKDILLTTPLLTPTPELRSDPPIEPTPKPVAPVTLAKTVIAAAVPIPKIEPAPKAQSAPAARLDLIPPLEHFTRTQGFHAGHTGVDLAAPLGTPVHAAADGCVNVSTGWNGGYGRMINEDLPDGYTLRYAHLSAFEPGITTGSCVKKGDVIGKVGSTGHSTGPHLHFEVRLNNRPLTPQF
jgi:murein DD-endopeptidase MepM/ murein hydrolase activator NlpD